MLLECEGMLFYIVNQENYSYKSRYFNSSGEGQADMSREEHLVQRKQKRG